jgi:deazaflavin-dependent oxidoreductase (nitroreductase family)
MLSHRGRRTGRLYRTVLEVVRWRPEESEAVVMSGFGTHAGWYRNVLDGGAVGIEIGGRRWRPEVRQLEPTEAASVLADYERRNRLVRPLARRILGRLAGFPYDGSEPSRKRLVQTLPLVAFRP